MLSNKTSKNQNQFIYNWFQIDNVSYKYITSEGLSLVLGTLIFCGLKVYLPAPVR